ncbi:MAG: hypothetical protein ACP5VC_14170, partial [Bryobacteraceae bacterium]
TPAYLMSAASVWAGARLILSGHFSLRWALTVAVSMGLLVAVRGNYVLILPLVLACAACLPDWGRRVGLACAVAIGCLVAGGVFWATAWINRAMSKAVRQDSFLTHVLIQGAFQYRTEILDWRAWEKETRAGSRDYADYEGTRRRLAEFQRMTGQPMPALEWEWLRRSFLREPWVWLRMAPVKAASALWFRISPMRVERVFGKGSIAELAAFGISLVLNAPVLAALILAVAWTRRAIKEETPALMMCWTPFAAGILFVSITYSEPRYLVPGMTGVVVLAALRLAQHLERLRGGRDPGAGVAGTIGA